MLIHSSKARAESGLNIYVNDVTVEQIRTFKYLGVLLNDTLLGVITWTWYVGK